MEVLINGEIYKTDRCDIIYRDEIIKVNEDGSEVMGDVYLKNNSEGLIIDVVESGVEDGVNATCYRFVDGLIGMAH
jgi:hypothetical protein